jgi:hypothetical protein
MVVNWNVVFVVFKSFILFWIFLILYICFDIILTVERLEDLSGGEVNGLVCFHGKDSSDINNAGEKWGSHLCTYSRQYVHTEYMHQFTNANKIKYFGEKEKSKLNPPAESTPIVRSKHTFLLGYHCLFCGQTARLSQNTT